MAKPLFELRRIYFSYLGKIPALCGIDLVIEEGSMGAVIGANGTGKSTLLTMLDALIFPDQGTMKAFGREIRQDVFSDERFLRFFRSKVGFVFQNPEVQLFCPTAREDILFGPLQLGVPHGEIRKSLERVVSDLKIAHLLERSAHQLSIGEKRKIAIASVLTIKPDVLILDEPTAGLDPQTTREIIDILLAENEAGKTIITATHDMHVMAEIANVVHVFSAEKKIIRSASPVDVLSDQQFLQAHNLIHVHRHRHKDIIHIHPHSHLDHHSSS